MIFGGSRMKKAIALILVLVMAVLFASCKKDKEEETQLVETGDTLPVASVGQDINNNPSVTTTEAPTTTEQTGETMILTTNYGETMPTVVTTKFDPANETTEATVPVSFEIPVMTAPSVYTSAMPTTAPTTTTTTATEHTEPTEPKNESSGSQTRKALEFSSYGISASKNITIEFDANGWNGGVKSGKFSASVTTDSGKTSTVVGRVVGIQSSDGSFSVVVPVEDIVTDEVSSVKVTIPAGAVTSRKGDQTSKAYMATINTG